MMKVCTIIVNSASKDVTKCSSFGLSFGFWFAFIRVSFPNLCQSI